MENRGFSLVEVLVCVAILAIFCIPLFRGFRLSAFNNNKAHHTQEATAYAQKTLETVKRMRIDLKEMNNIEGQLFDLLEDTSIGTPATSEVVLIDTDLRDTFDAYRGKAEYNSLFTVVQFKKENMNIGGREYDVVVTMDPRPYSFNKGADIPAEEETAADDANVYAVASVNEIDGMKFPLITDEINRYDDSILDTFLARAVAIKKQGEADAFGGNKQAIYRKLQKKIMVSIDADSGGNTVQVICDVEYKVDGFDFTQVYNVYNSSFPLDCGKSCVDASHDEKHFTGWKTGGKIYIFAKAYRDQGSYVGEHILSNEVEIKSSGVGNHLLDVYLIRGNYDMKSDNFSAVNIDGNNYSTVPYTDSNPLTGEKRYGDIQFHTNIKGLLSDLTLSPSDMVETVGEEKPRLRSYEVTVRLTESDSGELAAEVTSTKRVT